MEVQIEKAHGAGNDFILFTDFDDQVEMNPDLVKNLCDRHFGIGADGVIRITKAGEWADFFMDYWNSDGSIAEMCGNGIRCMTAHLRDKKLLEFSNLSIDTRAGIRDVELLDDRKIRVNMGPPVFNPREIPFNWHEKDLIGGRLMFPDGRSFYEVSCLSMGNPHFVLIVEDVDVIDVNELGPKIENNKMFPNKTNVEFAQVISRGHIKVKVWERGAGATLACGTGACAVAVAGRLRLEDQTNETVVISMPGGDLEVSWKGSLKHPSPVYLTGSTESVFKTQINLDRFI